MIAFDLHDRVVIGRHQRGDVAQAFGDDVEDRGGGGQRHVLFEARHAHARLQPARAGVRRLFAAGHAQQRGLAGAVAADEAYAFAAVDLHRRAIDQRQVAEGDRHAFKREQGHEQRSARSLGAGAPDGRARAQYQDAPEGHAGFEPRLAQDAGQLAEQLPVGAGE